MSVDINLQNLTKEFKAKRETFLAVDDISVTIPEGSFTTIVGPSGSGKTTTLRMIAGLEEPTEGKVLFGDEDVTEKPPQKRDISMVFQNIALYPHMTVRENIGYSLKLSGMSKADRNERILEAAELLQISEHLEKKPSDLSGGQQQRVALGAGFVTSPDVLLFDEPMSNLDAKLKAELRYEIQRLHREMDATMVYVTHDQTEAMTMSDYVMVMREGRIEQFDSPHRLFNYPATKFIAEFIGTPATNFLEYTVERHDGQVALDGVGHRIPLSEAVLADFVGENVTVGVRPQYLALNGGEFHIDVTVDVVELLGTESVVHTSMADGARIDVVSSSEDVQELTSGDEIEVGFDRENVFIFGEDQKTILVDQNQSSDGSEGRSIKNT